MDEIVSTAKNFFEKLSKVPFPAEIRPSMIWQNPIDSTLAPTISKASTFKEVIEIITQSPYYTVSTHNTHPVLPRLIEGFDKWLISMGCPLEAMDITIQESPYTSKELVVRKGNRKVTSGFFWHLGATVRITDKVKSIKSVFELGGGYGGLARIFKLYKPEVKYTIMDMPVSLYYSYIFIRSNFPGARILLVDDVQKLKMMNEDYDFIFIPCNFVDAVKDIHFDVAINMQSLSEMTPSACSRYLKLIQNDLNVDYFYNINRYGKHYDGFEFDTQRWNESIGNDSCTSTVALDQHWTVEFWDLYKENGYKQIDPRYMNLLEIMVKRIPPALRNVDFYQSISESLYAEAIARIKIDDTWHRLMWDAVRYFPTKENLDLIIQIYSEKRFLQAAHYEAIRKKMFPEKDHIAA